MDTFICEDIASALEQEFSVRVMDYIREKIESVQEETGDIILEATSAKGTGYRFAMIGKKNFPGAICVNEEGFMKKADAFYTNSTQLPVNYL